MTLQVLVQATLTLPKSAPSKKAKAQPGGDRAATASDCNDGGHVSTNGASSTVLATSGTLHVAPSSGRVDPNHDHASAGNGPRPCTT